jgi:hypothetical protein
MNDKLKKLEIKKLLQEYNFLLLDDEYKKEIISDNRPEFLEKVQKLKSDMGVVQEPEIKPEKKEDVKEDLPKKPKLDPNSINKSTRDKVKKLYREIVKKTHPDKTNSEDLINLYMKATIASDDYNLFELFIICIELNIDIDIDINDKDTLTVLIEMKKNELKSIEASFIWIYYMAKTEEEKNKLIELFVKKHGTKN